MVSFFIVHSPMQNPSKIQSCIAPAMMKTAKIAAQLIIITFLMSIMNVVEGGSDHVKGQLKIGDGGDDSKGLFIMGDSSVDCGENTLFYSLLHGSFSLLPCNGSDSTIPHFLAKLMGLPKVPPFYVENDTVSGMLHGLNFGSALATIISTNSSSPRFQSLNQQLRQVLDVIQLLQLQLGFETANQFIQSSVFHLSFGKDDYIHFLRHNSSLTSETRHESGCQNEFCRDLVDEMMKVVRELYDANARKIICLGILPLGCAPRTRFEWSSIKLRENKERGCIKEINQLVSEYNVKLREQIYDLKIKLPDLHITFCDVYQGVMDVLAKPNRYGFKDVTTACCGIGWLGARVGCLSRSVACNHSSSHVWWDLYNPTEAVNSLLTDSFWSNHPFRSLCHPLTVQDLFHAL
ncbi:hypothetical protein Drorol1_Dr00019179 [Drosera rotundifolia]